MCSNMDSNRCTANFSNQTKRPLSMKSNSADRGARVEILKCRMGDTIKRKDKLVREIAQKMDEAEIYVQIISIWPPPQHVGCPGTG